MMWPAAAAPACKCGGHVQQRPLASLPVLHPSTLHLASICNAALLNGAVTTIDWTGLNLAHNVHALNHLAKDHVPAVAWKGGNNQG